MCPDGAGAGRRNTPGGASDRSACRRSVAAPDRRPWRLAVVGLGWYPFALTWINLIVRVGPELEDHEKRGTCRFLPPLSSREFLRALVRKQACPLGWG